MDILDDMDGPEEDGMSASFGGPGEYMMMDTDEVDTKTPELPRRTEESKQLMGDPKEEPLADSLYCEPAPVWNSPSSEWILASQHPSNLSLLCLQNHQK